MRGEFFSMTNYTKKNMSLQGHNGHNAEKSASLNIKDEILSKIQTNMTIEEASSIVAKEVSEKFKIETESTEIEKSKKWDAKKAQNEKYSTLLDEHAFSETMRERISGCGNTLAFALNSEDGKLQLHQAFFCKNRLCPYCAWRRALKTSHVAREVVQMISDSKKYKNSPWLFLTLTLKNCEASEVREMIRLMNKALLKLFRRKKFKNFVLGYMKTIEVTYNAEDDTYHPHLHVLILVTSTYFKGDNYVKQSEWALDWQKATKVDYTPIVNVKRVRRKITASETQLEHEGKEFTSVDFKDDYSAAVAEVVKYQVKPSDYLDIEDTKQAKDVIAILNKELKNARFISFSGVLKEYREKIQDEAKAEAGGDSEKEDDMTPLRIFDWYTQQSKYRARSAQG